MGAAAIMGAAITAAATVAAITAAVATGGGHHGGAGHHAAGRHVAVHHAAAHRGGGHRAVAHHAAVHHTASTGAKAHQSVRHVAATNMVGGRGLASRTIMANPRAVVTSAGTRQVGNRAGYGYAGNRTRYSFGYGAGYGLNAYGRRPWYGNYGYGFGNSYPYVYNQYTYNTPYYGVSGAGAPSALSDPVTEWLSTLGIDGRSVVDSTGPAVQVSVVYAGSPAERAGLIGGDLIRAANGYASRDRDELARDVANTPPNGVLALSVRSIGDVVDHTVSVVLP